MAIPNRYLTGAMIALPGRARTLVPLVILACSLGSLAVALVAEHVFGLEPCSLCIYQRVPFVITAMLAAAALIVPTASHRRAVMVLIAIVFFGGAALAFFHVGVEEHWWTSSLPGCGGAPPAVTNIEDLQAQLAEPPPKPCDEVDWRLFGLSLAGYNVLFSLALAVATVIGIRLMGRGEDE